MIKTNTIIQHDVTKDFPLPDSCIDVVITSPPYWGLRDYGVDGQIGLESHPQEYIDKLVGVAREIKRVLKKSGSFYLNLGDTYFGSGAGTDKTNQEPQGKEVYKLPYGCCRTRSSRKRVSDWLQPKQLMLIPVRVAIALQDDGWVLRNDIIWHKPNPMPSSVKDRLNNTFEHVFHFVKSRKYYYDLDAIREPHKASNKTIERAKVYDRSKTTLGEHQEGRAKEIERGKTVHIEYNPNGKNPGDTFEGGAILGESGAIKVPGGKGWTKKIPGGGNACSKDPRWCPPEGKNPGDIVKHDIAVGRIGNFSYDDPLHTKEYNPNGKNPGDFWDITTQPFTSYSRDLEHFAVFPKELIIKPLKASCPVQICNECGAPRKRIVELGDVISEGGSDTGVMASNKNAYSLSATKCKKMIAREHHTKGWSDCRCNAGFTSGVVLDPFCGRGTVGRVAKELGLNYVLFDISPDYCELARLYVNGQKRKLIKNQGRLET